MTIEQFAKGSKAWIADMVQREDLIVNDNSSDVHYDASGCRYIMPIDKADIPNIIAYGKEKDNVYQVYRNWGNPCIAIIKPNIDIHFSLEAVDKNSDDYQLTSVNIEGDPGSEEIFMAMQTIASVIEFIETH